MDAPPPRRAASSFMADRGVSILGRPEVCAVRHDRDGGVGAAIRSGIREAMRLGTRAIARADGEGQVLAADSRPWRGGWPGDADPRMRPVSAYAYPRTRAERRSREGVVRIRFSIVKLVERMTGTRIYRVLPRGLDVFHDVRRGLPRFRAATVFDVGANVGQSALLYRQRFPESHIYCFEPVAGTFQQLRENVGALERIRYFQLALGSSSGHGTMKADPDSVFSSLVTGADEPARDQHGTVEDVEITTLDEFCGATDVPEINFLRIDAEGADLEVLKGRGNARGPEDRAGPSRGRNESPQPTPRSLRSAEAASGGSWVLSVRHLRAGAGVSDTGAASPTNGLRVHLPAPRRGEHEATVEGEHAVKRLRSGQPRRRLKGREG